MKDSISLVVAARLGVLAPVDLDDEPPIEADEVQNVTFNWSLPAELKTGQTPIPQQAPHRCFGVGRGTAHGFREAAISFRDRPMVKAWRHRPLTRHAFARHPLPQGRG